MVFNTLRPRQLDVISQTFSNVFSWMKIHQFRFIFHWSLFLRVELTIFKHWYLAPTRRQAIIWNNDGKFTDAYFPKRLCVQDFVDPSFLISVYIHLNINNNALGHASFDVLTFISQTCKILLFYILYHLYCLILLQGSAPTIHCAWAEQKGMGLLKLHYLFFLEEIFDLPKLPFKFQRDIQCLTCVLAMLTKLENNERRKLAYQPRPLVHQNLHSKPIFHCIHWATLTKNLRYAFWVLQYTNGIESPAIRWFAFWQYVQ